MLIPGSDIKKDGVWIIATEKREKGNAGAIKLPDLVLGIIKRQPRLAGNDYVFAVPKGKGYLSGWSDCKEQIDKVLDEFEPWVIHDARRTCKSLCSKLHIDRVVSEALLGHKLKGVEGTYDRYSRFDEKSAAVQAVANYVSGLRFRATRWSRCAADATEQPRWGKVGKQKIVDEGPLAPYPDMSNVPDMHDITPKAKYDMTTFDEVLVKASSDFMDKAKADGKPFFVWHNTTRMHVWTFLAPKYQALMNSQTNYGPRRSRHGADGR